MHIAQFIQRYPPALGGSELYTQRLCHYLASHGDEVSVWTSTAIRLEEMWKRTTTCESGAVSANAGSESGGTRARVSIRRYAPLYFPTRRVVLKACSLIPDRFWQCLTAPANPICPGMWRDANRYLGPLDAVHATAFPYSFPIVCALRLAQRRGVPLLLTPFLHLGNAADRGDPIRKQFTAPHLQWLLKQAAIVFVQTNTEREAVIELGIPASRVILHGLGVDARECTGGDRNALRRAHGIHDDEVVIGHLANNSFEKGTVDMLCAAESLWKSGSRFRLLLAGPEMPNFQRYWQRFVRKDHVVRLGVLGDEQKRDFFAATDVFALPSRCDSFGLVLLEAWANSKPVIAYHAGGPGELVRHEVDGLLAECGNLRDLAACLRRIVHDQKLQRRLGANGLSRIEHEFQWEERLEIVRETLLKLHNRRTRQVTTLPASRIAS